MYAWSRRRHGMGVTSDAIEGAHVLTRLASPGDSSDQATPPTPLVHVKPPWEKVLRDRFCADSRRSGAVVRDADVRWLLGTYLREQHFGEARPIFRDELGICPARLALTSL
jgi:hypothetical protein